MALNIKNQQVDMLLGEVTRMTGESKTEAVRKALEERRQRLAHEAAPIRDESALLAFLEDEIWPQIPVELLGTRLSKAEEEAILGYGAEGV
jgi:antitoxin VapB